MSPQRGIDGEMHPDTNCGHTIHDSPLWDAMLMRCVSPECYADQASELLTLLGVEITKMEAIGRNDLAPGLALACEIIRRYRAISRGVPPTEGHP